MRTAATKTAKESLPTLKRTDSHWRRNCFRYHPLLGWWHIANLRARIALGGTFHNFQTNGIGMRADRDYAKRRPSGKTRILVLGDSYAAGDGVSTEQRASDLVERRNPGLEILNFALNGSGTDQQLLIFENLAKRYTVDAFLWFFCVENIARNKYQCFPSYVFSEHRTVFRPKPYFDLAGDNLVLRNVPVPRERRAADNLGDWAYRFPYLPEFPDDPYAIYRFEDGEHWRLMRAIIQRLIRQARGKPVFLVPLPMDVHYLEKAPATYWPRFRSLSDESRNVHVLNVLPAFCHPPKSVREWFRFENDPHYTASAHALLADTVEYQMKRLCPDLFAGDGT